jgi:hypothetical protein
MKHTAMNLTVLALAIVLLLSPTLAWAQAAEGDDRPQPRPEELTVVKDVKIGSDGFDIPEEMVGAPWSGLLWGLVALAVVVSPVFVSARRSHFD